MILFQTIIINKTNLLGVKITLTGFKQLPLISPQNLGLLK